MANTTEAPVLARDRPECDQCTQNSDAEDQTCSIEAFVTRDADFWIDDQVHVSSDYNVGSSYQNRAETPPYIDSTSLMLEIAQ